MREIPADPLSRFCDIYQALNAERSRPDRQVSFSLAASTAFLDLARLECEAKEITEVKALIDMQAMVQAQQAAAAAAAGAAAAAS